MLLRNLDPVRSHCNGTRYIVRHITRQYTEAQVACGEYAGNMLLIPRFPMTSTDFYHLHCAEDNFQCSQPLRCPSTSHKGKQVGTLLDEPVFTLFPLQLFISVGNEASSILNLTSCMSLRRGMDSDKSVFASDWLISCFHRKFHIQQTVVLLLQVLVIFVQ